MQIRHYMNALRVSAEGKQCESASMAPSHRVVSYTIASGNILSAYNPSLCDGH